MPVASKTQSGGNWRDQFCATAKQTHHQVKAQQATRTEEALEQVEELLSHKDGMCIQQLMLSLDLGATECRTAIREIVDLGGEIEVQTNDTTGTQVFYLRK